MKDHHLSLQDAMFQQIVSETGLAKKQDKESLKRQINKKYPQHINLIQYHQLREDRFILSQKKVLEKQNQSIQKAKEFISLRQEKANSNKNHTLIQKSKRVEADLNRWEQVIEKNKNIHEKRLKESINLIKGWHDKLSSTSSRKSSRLNNVSKTLHEKSTQKLNRVSSFRNKVQLEYQEKYFNPQSPQNNQKQSRYTVHKRGNHEFERHSRVSTESMHDRKKKYQQQLLEKSLLKTGEKQERINEARYMKHYLLERKTKLKHQKDESNKKMREYHLNIMKNHIQERNEQLDQKYKNFNIKKRNKRNSLPLISGSKATNMLLLNGPGEEWRKHSVVTNQMSPKNRELNSYTIEPYKDNSRILEPSFDRLVTQKLRDVALLMRKGRKP